LRFLEWTGLKQRLVVEPGFRLLVPAMPLASRSLSGLDSAVSRSGQHGNLKRDR